MHSDSAPMRLMIIIASTRPGRAGLPVGTWFAGQAERHGGLEVDLVDLAELNLPMMDEPNHPRLRRYTHQHTLEWSERVDAADAFVFVTPEYNHSFPAPLKNAIDYLSQEWQYKPAGFVSYGGVAGGTRAVQSLKPVLDILKMTAVPESVVIPFISQLMDNGVFTPGEPVEAAAQTMLDELDRWATALSPLRGKEPALTTPVPSAR
jgi:NAD(P)H-dependent FMN reductase